MFCEDTPVYILQYPLENNIDVSYWLFNLINEYEIKYTFNTEHWSSGLPILNWSTNKIFDVHKQSSKNNNYNIGTCLQYPINIVLILDKQWV